MEALLGALVLIVVLAIGFGLLALPFALVRIVLRSPRTPARHPSASRPPEWTDDDEIEARHHI